MSWTTRSHELLAAQAQQLAQVLRDIDPTEPAIAERHYRSSNGGDHLKLRGIPAIGRNVAGAIPGSSPHNSLR